VSGEGNWLVGVDGKVKIYARFSTEVVREKNHAVETYHVKRASKAFSAMNMSE